MSSTEHVTEKWLDETLARADKLIRENAALRAEAEVLQEHLAEARRVAYWLSFPAPEPPGHSCGPESMCDSTCGDYFYYMQNVNAARAFFEGEPQA